MFVFGEVQDPNMETVNLVEDIVRSQLIELVSTFSQIIDHKYSSCIDRASSGTSYAAGRTLPFS